LLKGKFAKIGIDVTKEPVAISDLKRTYETAFYAGLTGFTKYSLLNEIDSGLAPNVLDDMLKQKKLPKAALEAARAILENPPVEKVWITHGLVIGALAHELGISPNELFIPETGSITKLELS
jgi:broad specificity phosphatase PhoE